MEEAYVFDRDSNGDFSPQEFVRLTTIEPENLKEELLRVKGHLKSMFMN